MKLIWRKLLLVAAAVLVLAASCLAQEAAKLPDDTKPGQLLFQWVKLCDAADDFTR